MAGRSRRRWSSSEVLRLRLELGLTQEQMAEEIGVRQQTVSEWETGAYAPRGASLTVLALLADRLGVSYDASETDAAR